MKTKKFNTIRKYVSIQTELARETKEQFLRELKGTRCYKVQYKERQRHKKPVLDDDKFNPILHKQ